eukprot:2253061-Pyramimonas_sp.AAC.1
MGASTVHLSASGWPNTIACRRRHTDQSDAGSAGIFPTMDQSDAGSMGIFPQWTNRTQEAW